MCWDYESFGKTRISFQSVFYFYTNLTTVYFSSHEKFRNSVDQTMFGFVF